MAKKSSSGKKTSKPNLRHKSESPTAAPAHTPAPGATAAESTLGADALTFLHKLDATLLLAAKKVGGEAPWISATLATHVQPRLAALSAMPLGQLSLRMQSISAHELPGAPAATVEKIPLLIDVQPDKQGELLQAVRAMNGDGEAVGATTVLVNLPPQQLSALAHLAEVRFVEASYSLRPHMDRAHASSGLFANNLPTLPQTGKGVLIGVIDSGIDAAHPAFQANGQQRIIQYLDQTMSPQVRYTQAELQAGNAAASPDTVGHGTHVAGIAAGNGGGSPGNVYRGVAPEADIAIVKTDFKTDKIVAGLKFLFDLAKQRNQACVVNLSLGGHFGAHDGTSVMERTIDQLSGPGRIVVASAGNEGRDSIHAATVLPIGQATPQRWTANFSLTPRNVNGQLLGYLVVQVWHYREDDLKIQLRAPNGELFQLSTPQDMEFDRQVFFVNASRQIAPYNGDTVHTFTVIAVPQNQWLGGWSVIAEEAAVGAANVGSVHAWILDSDMGSFSSGLAPGYLVGMPSTAFSVISVASYATRGAWQSRDPNMPNVAPQGIVTENISYFSSPGPTRDGDNKPEIAAPGQWLLAPLSASASFNDVPLWTRLANNVPYAAMQGTSMASPYVAGAIALLLQKDRSLDWAEVKRRLFKSAQLDRQTQVCWNPRWGYGKLNVRRLLSIDPG